jgi:hypothetical protein
MRYIQEAHPDVQFDWDRLIKGAAEQARGQAPESRHESRPGKPPRRERDQGRPRPQQEPPPPATPPAEIESKSSDQPPPVEPPPIEEIAMPDPPEAVVTKLGAEGVARLRLRYREAMSRIASQIQEPEKAAELKALAERLNPDAWLTMEDVNAGLEQYEPVLESLRAVIGRGGRRRRGR